ncbi:hypothetical protein TW83_09905 [Paracoccus sp. S4493]|uniref:ParA family protein n=1 Tax=Paracoccus sp. S4493 TaxID=579490 RepID=UPI0005FA1786|nr:ParA family protein [Paracoccus sp. S4493]KJZ31229.1 hypothetical protein TW83_09905 [Paracoccus sp. S4493]
MKIIVVTSQKGGAGKTTVALNISVAAAQKGLRTLMIDLDPQQSLRGWWSGREVDQPTMLEKDPSPSALTQALKPLAEHFDLIVIDTPPAAPDWLVDVMRHADLVLIPVRPSPQDLRAVGATLRIVRASKAKFAFVLSQTPRAKLTEQSARALAQHGRVAPVNLHQRIIYAENGATGHGAVESLDKKAAEEIADLWSFIQEKIDE